MKLLPTMTLSLAMLAAAGPAGAGCSSRALGSTVFHACDDGRTGTSRTIGNTTFHEFAGQRGVSRTFGTTTFHDFDGRSAMSPAVVDTASRPTIGRAGTSLLSDGTAPGRDGLLRD